METRSERRVILLVERPVDSPLRRIDGGLLVPLKLMGSDLVIISIII